MQNLTLVLASLIIFGAILSPGFDTTYHSPTSIDLPLPSPTAQPAPSTITISAVGDILLHAPLQRQAGHHQKGFSTLWQEVLPWIQAADIAYANLEGAVAAGLTSSGRQIQDSGVYDNQAYTSYPLFNYPPRLVDDLHASGFDIVSTANNHALDRGSRGADMTIERLNRVGLAYVGTRPSDAGEGVVLDWVKYTTVGDGVILAWVACTYDTNGIPDRASQVLHCYKDKAIVLEAVSQASQRKGVSAVIVTPHWGNEYQDKPVMREKGLAQELVDAGALVILGSHPHVPQPWEVLRHSGTGRPSLVVYSLGNFVSGQFHRLHTRASVLVNVHLSAVPGQPAEWVGANYVPLEMRRTDRGYEVQPLLDGRGTPAIGQHLVNQFGPWDRGLMP